MAKSFVAFPLIALASAAFLTASPAMLSAATHHPARKAAAHKAAPTNDVTAWLAKCQSSDTECAIGVSEARASFKVTQAMFHDPDYCVPAADDESHVLAPKVVAWLKEHPGHNPDPVYTGINAALGAMYPCKQ